MGVGEIEIDCHKAHFLPSTRAASLAFIEIKIFRIRTESNFLLYIIMECVTKKCKNYYEDFLVRTQNFGNKKSPHCNPANVDKVNVQ